MIVSINTIMCDRQTVLFFGQEIVVVVEACEILLFIFFKKEVVIVEETLWNWYDNAAKKYFFTLSLYSTCSTY